MLFNERETIVLAGVENPDDATRWFQEYLPSGATLVVKRGPERAVAWRSAERIVCPAQPLQVIDTIGAGDAFNAGYLLGHTTGNGLAESVRMGVSMAYAAISTFPRRFILDEAPPAA